MSHHRVLAVGIDGFDPLLVEKWIDDLPNIRGLLDKGRMFRTDSVLPTDSATAWPSVYMSVNPAKHGIIQHFDYFQIEKMRSSGVDKHGSILKGRTFWDTLSEAGRKVAIINPFSAYPAWVVNGVMVSGPFFKGEEVTCFPPSLKDTHNLPSIGGMTHFPKMDTLNEFYADCLQETADLTRFAVSIFQEHEFDLYFVCYLAADRVQHFLWRFSDPQDPTHIPANPHADKIHNFYKFMDSRLAQLMASVPTDTKVILFSDHGHGMRCTKFFNVNEFLRQRGLLNTRKRGASSGYLIEVLKNKALGLVNRHDLQDWVYRICKSVPALKKLKKPHHLISVDSPGLAQGDDFAGSNPFGGIRISQAAADKAGIDYHDLRDQIIDSLLHLRDPDGGPVVRWAKSREQLYQGEHIGKYPDIVYYLEEAYGSHWSLFDGIVSESYTHKKISGGHKLRTTLIVSGERLSFAGETATIMDIAPTILGVMGHDVPKSYEGKPVAACDPESQLPGNEDPVD